MEFSYAQKKFLKPADTAVAASEPANISGLLSVLLILVLLLVVIINYTTGMT